MDYTMMKIFIICSLILGIILFVNYKNKKINYLISFINISLIMMIIYYYHNYLISNLTFINIMHNIYFYYLNSIIYLIVLSICFYKFNKFRPFFIVVYIISLILLSFSLFMTSYAHNINLIVIGNIYPMIVYGNYLYLILYVFVLIIFIKKIISKNNKDIVLGRK